MLPIGHEAIRGERAVKSKIHLILLTLMAIGADAKIPSDPKPLPISSIVSHLVLKACCGDTEDTCERFKKPEEMIGIDCCGLRPYNQYEEICCDNVIRSRRGSTSYIDRCCGNQTLAFDQTCCQGVVHNIANGECCGAQAYPRNNLNILCCNGVLNPNVEPGRSCCGTTPYDGGIKETCCGGLVVPKELFDGCCPVQGSNPPEFRQFNSNTHQCCDAPIEIRSSTKCCYLRQNNGQFIPKSYDSARTCCAFPYGSITPKQNGSCIAAIPSMDDHNTKPDEKQTVPLAPSQPSGQHDEAQQPGQGGGEKTEGTAPNVDSSGKSQPPSNLEPGPAGNTTSGDQVQPIPTGDHTPPPLTPESQTQLPIPAGSQVQPTTPAGSQALTSTPSENQTQPPIPVGDQAPPPVPAGTNQVQPPAQAGDQTPSSIPPENQTQAPIPAGNQVQPPGDQTPSPIPAE